jgi:hypothetical protein
MVQLIFLAKLLLYKMLLHGAKTMFKNFRQGVIMY